MQQETGMLRTPMHRTLLAQPYVTPERRANNQRLWDEYIDGRDTIGLNIGSGTALKPAFLNCDLEPMFDDVFALDAARSLPWESDSLDYVFSEHMIEHISYERGGTMLRECFRVLRPGGTIRIVTPSIEFLWSLFAPDPPVTVAHYLDWAQRHLTPGAPAPLPAFVFNTFVRSWGHTFIYDRATLRLTLRDAGFAAVRECRISVSEVASLNGIEAVHRMPPGFLELESMIFEGRKESAAA